MAAAPAEEFNDAMLLSDFCRVFARAFKALSREVATFAGDLYNAASNFMRLTLPCDTRYRRNAGIAGIFGASFSRDKARSLA